MIYSGVKISVLKTKTIQKAEKQKQYISENDKNLKKKEQLKKIKTVWYFLRIFFRRFGELTWPLLFTNNVLSFPFH